MRCPTLAELPPPPPGKTGWPWTVESPQLPDTMPDGHPWPKISIVTPNYNYGQFIEETIRSVLLQGYSNIEYIIIDGVSTDNSIEIIKKYEKYLAYWVSEPDNGQTDALNKGYQHCNGEIFAWINSDDAYATPFCFQNVSESYKRGYEFIVGRHQHIDLTPNGINIEAFNRQSRTVTFEQYLKFWEYQSIHQPTVFAAKLFTDKCFPLDPTLYYLMDYQLFLRILSQKPKSTWINQNWITSYVHGRNKTLKSDPRGLVEIYQVALAESKRLPYIHRKFFTIDLKDNISLKFLLNREKFPTLWEVIALLMRRPTIIRLKLFWKIFLKSLIGQSLYSSIKIFLCGSR